MEQLMRSVWQKIAKKEYAYPFWTALIVGFLTHMPVLVNKFPNSDAMANFYADQNMITSGRWFLSVVCGISSFYDLNWVIGVLSVFYLALAAVMLCEFFELKSMVNRMLTAALLVTFPAVCATFAYMYTMDGYMIGLILSVLAAYLARKGKGGIAAGAICLGLSLGIYQAYLAVTILLCIFDLIKDCLYGRKIAALWNRGFRYLLMGVSGGAFYMAALKILLAASAKELDTYQGINEMGSVHLAALPSMLFGALKDFAAFAVKGNIFINNGFSLVAVVLLSVVALAAALFCYVKAGDKKRWYHLVIIGGFCLLIPFATNVILLFSAEAYYHLLMRMQWVLFPVFAVVLADLCSEAAQKKAENAAKKKCGIPFVTAMLTTLSVMVLSYTFAVADNIAYFNMNERYERTYAYCLRLLDRMEETPGYEPGMPVAMIGVIDESKYPNTDITEPVTARISGSGGSTLLYKGEQYAAFMKHYMNVSFEVIEGDELVKIYNSDEYRSMDSFPALNSMQVVDGILYVKTEAKE